jgi:single-strand DNA-binding protein
MSGINQATILGRVGKDPETKTFNSGDKIANFSIATSETWKDKQTGERKEKTQWHNIVVKSDGLVRVVEQYVKKGDRIFVQGAIETRKWTDQSGADKYVTEIVLGPFNSKLELLGDRSGSGDSDSRGGQTTAGGRQSAPQNDIDDDIPF